MGFAGGHNNIGGGLSVVAARLATAVTRVLFRAFLLLPQQRKITFMSRQGARPLDFRLLEPELRAVFPECEIVWACVPKGGRLGVSVFMRQLWHTATSRLCIIDGYVPAVSLCNGLHRAVCVQLWHALGAFKKFGCQSLDTPAGHSGRLAEALRIHEGYDYAVVGLPGAAGSFSQAFGYTREAMVSLGLPRVDYVLNRRACAEAGDFEALNLPEQLEDLRLRQKDGRVVVLYAPTFRKGVGFGENWLADSVCSLEEAFSSFDMSLVVARHPLRTNEPRSRAKSNVGRSTMYLSGVSSVDALCCVDVVVTDYSAIAFEAWLAGKKVFFYVPDIAAYRYSPGLNVDPLASFPDVSFTHAPDLADAVARFAEKERGEDPCPEQESSFDLFMDGYAAGSASGSTERLANWLHGVILAREADLAPSYESANIAFEWKEGDEHVVGNA